MDRNSELPYTRERLIVAIQSYPKARAIVVVGLLTTLCQAVNKVQLYRSVSYGFCTDLDTLFTHAPDVKMT